MGVHTLAYNKNKAGIRTVSKPWRAPVIWNMQKISVAPMKPIVTTVATEMNKYSKVELFRTTKKCIFILFSSSDLHSC